MKKILLPLLFLAAINVLNGQIPFAPVGAKWYIKIPAPCFGFPGAQDAYEVREVTTDSIIQGKYCTLIETNNGPTCQNSYFVHQDGEKVYVLNEESGDFQLLYDFEAPMGATWKIAVCDWFYGTDSMTITVKDVQPTFQKVDMTPDSSGGFWDYINHRIYKGIGGQYDNPLLFHTDFIVPDCETKLLCYETPTTSIIQISGNFCVPNATDEPARAEETILLYPNPTSSKSILQLASPLTAPSKWILIDQLGRTVQQETLPVGLQEQEVQLDGMPPGLYFWVLTSEEKQVSSGKLVIAK